MGYSFPRHVHIRTVFVNSTHLWHKNLLTHIFLNFNPKWGLPYWKYFGQDNLTTTSRKCLVIKALYKQANSLLNTHLPQELQRQKLVGTSKCRHGTTKCWLTFNINIQLYQWYILCIITILDSLLSQFGNFSMA